MKTANSPGTNAAAVGSQVTAPQSGKAGPDRDRRNQLEGEEVASDSEPVGIVDGLLRSHDGQTAHPGSNLYPTGPGGSRQDVGGDVNSDELNADNLVAGVSAALPVDAETSPRKSKRKSVH